MKKALSVIFVFLVLLVGCMGPPVRDPVKLDLSAPVGKIEDNQFIGIRYPFKVSAPPNWKVTMKYPDFMEALGYYKEGLEESQAFVFNPVTQSNLQIELTPAGKFATFDQKKIEEMVSGISGEFTSDVGKDYGTGTVLSPTVPISLKGVQYAAKNMEPLLCEASKENKGGYTRSRSPIRFLFFILSRRKKERATMIGRI